MLLCLIWLQMHIMRYRITSENTRTVIYKGSFIFLTGLIHRPITHFFFYFGLNLIALGLNQGAKSHWKLKLNPFACFLVTQRGKHNIFWVYSFQWAYISLKTHWLSAVWKQWQAWTRDSQDKKKHRYLANFLERRTKTQEMTFFYSLEEGQRAECFCSGGQEHLQPVANDTIKLPLQIFF